MMKPRFFATGAALVVAGLGLALPATLTRSAQSAPTAPAKPADAPKANAATQAAAKTMSIYDFKAESLDGKPVDLAKYKGKTVLIVNTASKCGNTPQYAGLQALSEKYKAQGLQVLGFPADNFAHQEPGTNSEIGEFCKKNYGVTFDMFAKSSVKGEDKSPLFEYLTTQPEMTGDIDWNFAKFLVSPDGKLVARFKSSVQPDSPELTKAVENQLAKK